MSCSGIDEYHIYYCTNIDQDDGGGVDDPGDDGCPNGCDDTGGGSDGDDDDDDEEEKDTNPKFTLSCDVIVERGDTAGCTVSVSGENEEGEPYTADNFHFGWAASSGTSGDGSGNEWRGTATETTTITVRVTSEEYMEMRVIQVSARSVESLPQLDADAAYYSHLPRSLNDFYVGYYLIPEVPPGRVGRTGGSGPWAGTYMTNITIESSFYSELHVSIDYASGGPTYPRADSTTCAAATSALSSIASYEDVNVVCNTATAWAAFGAEIETHEWQHQSSWNTCLSSASATAMLEDLEAATGNVPQISDAIDDIWEDWWNNTWEFSGGAMGRDTGDPFWSYHGGGWIGPLYLGIRQDGGTYGC